MRRSVLVLIVLLGACGASESQPPAKAKTAAAAVVAEPPANLIALAEGGVLVSASANPAKALSLNDGSSATSWENGVPRFAAPYTFVFELRAPTRLMRVGVVGAGKRPAGLAGASAKRVRIEASSESATAGFAPVGALDAAEDGETLIDASLARDMRWLRFIVEGNHGPDTRWTYFSEAVAYGRQTAPADPQRFAGVYDLGRRATMELKISGASVTGCYTENGGFSPGTLNGEITEGVARIAWRASQGDRLSGTALLVVDSKGSLNGVRHIQKSRTIWAGPRAPAGATTACSAQPAPSNPVSDALTQDGEVRIYGILFDYDQATIKSSSEPALRQLRAALQTNAAMRVDIEGHTDSMGEDAYNLALSARRAQSVVAWLTSRGVAAARLNPVGKGETEPVAGNESADGRALNRRVDVAKRE